MNKTPKISIVIPLYVISDRFFSDLERFGDLEYPNYEILIICDRKVDITVPKARLILTGIKNTGPAEKRDIALTKAKGEILAFIDDDAYPDRNWLTNAVIHFQDKKIAAVGGPGITPAEDSYWPQLTGLVYSSFFCGGFARHRFIKEKARFIEDYPAYNLLVRKDILKKVGGYGSNFYGGEDTFLCLKIIEKGFKIFYDPEVSIYHHRRPLFIPYLKQIFNVGVHRGYFAKAFPRTSRRISYFIPSILSIGFVLSVIFVKPVFIILFLSFLLIGAFSVIEQTNLINAIIVGFAIILTHLSYGTGFIKGLFTKNLTR